MTVNFHSSYPDFSRYHLQPVFLCLPFSCEAVLPVGWFGIREKTPVQTSLREENGTETNKHEK
jgi:hypothetical protein